MTYTSFVHHLALLCKTGQKQRKKNSDRDSNSEHAGICINPSERAQCMSNLNVWYPGCMVFGAE